jgi:hypothetical protein
MVRQRVTPLLVAWTEYATGRTASRPGEGYWVGIGNRGGKFKVSVAYDETVVGDYVVGSQDEASVIQRQLLTPSRLTAADSPRRLP